MWEEISKTIGTVAPMLGTLLAPVTGGASVAIGAMVSSALGVDNNPESIAQALKSPEALEKMRDLELREKELLNKHILELAKLENEKYKTAHHSYREKSQMADSIARDIITRNLPIIALLVSINIGLVYFMKDDAPLIAIASNIIGFSIGNLFNERQAIVNFFFGSSIGSKEKDKRIYNEK